MSEKVLSYIINSLLLSFNDLIEGKIIAELKIDKGIVRSKACVKLRSTTTKDKN